MRYDLEVLLPQVKDNVALLYSDTLCVAESSERQQHTTRTSSPSELEACDDESLL